MSAAPTPLCPECGPVARPGARFCPACGARLTRPRPPTGTRVGTAIFCDLVGSTALGEQRDPEAVREAVGRYLAGIRSAVEDHGGSVVKIIGDAALALFEPRGDPADGARRAVEALGDVRHRLDALNGDLEAEWGVRLSTHIGAATAPVAYVDAWPDVLVDGEAIDLAMLLEQAAGADEVVVCATTWKLADRAAAVDPLGTLALADGRSCAAVRLRRR